MTRAKSRHKHEGRPAEQQQLADLEAHTLYGVQRLASPARCAGCGTLNVKMNRAKRRCLVCMMKALEARR